MATHYTTSDYNYLKSKAEKEGRVLNLVLCSDAIMRTKENRDRFEQTDRVALPSPDTERR